MNRRQFIEFGLAGTAMASLSVLSPTLSAAVMSQSNPRLLVLVELKGGNDGLNTLIPYTDPRYYALRPKIGIAANSVLPLSEQLGLHPALSPLMPLWESKQLAVIQGVGYPKPNLSHFRSIEIWDSASASEQTLNQGWLTQIFKATPLPANFIADGLVIGSSDLGPLYGARALVIGKTPVVDTGMSGGAAKTGNSALGHLLKVEHDLHTLAGGLKAAAPMLSTTFPEQAFGKTVKTAMEALAKNGQIGVLRLTLSGFDTHTNQLATQSRLLKELAEGLIALQSGLIELGRWNDAVVLTYAEFGRRVTENRSGGTDHGTASVHFAMGGAVRGGLYGKSPDLNDLDNGNLKFNVDFRSIYADVADWCWGQKAKKTIIGAGPRLGFLA